MKMFRQAIATGLVCVLLIALMFSVLGASYGSGVKAVYQGSGTESVLASTTETKEVAVTTIVVAKSALTVWAVGTHLNTNIAGEITGTTTIDLFLTNMYSDTQTITYSWQVIEYY